MDALPLAVLIAVSEFLGAEESLPLEFLRKASSCVVPRHDKLQALANVVPAVGRLRCRRFGTIPCASCHTLRCKKHVFQQCGSVLWFCNCG